MQVGNFAVWINNDTEYADNIAAFSKTYKRMADQLPFFIWRDASVQHFSVCTSRPKFLQLSLDGANNSRWELKMQH